MRAIVTGGAGFIGSHLVDALVARGDEVTVVDNFASGRHENVNEAAKLRERDIREPFQVDADVVFHFAAQADVRVSVERPGYDADVNVVGTINVLEAARAASANVVFASTGGAIYGECERPASEDAKREPLAPYGTSKLCGEEYLATYNRLYGTRHVSLRLGNVYGPRQDPHGEAGVVAIFLSRLRDGRPPRVFGNGEQVRDYVYVADVVRATLAAAERSGGVYNVGTGVATSVLELADLCRRVSGNEIAHELASARPGELQRSVLDPSAAARELGWRPEVELEQGLRETWDWIAAR
ncbi:MAG: NAD-dependent epimerase/dehydratase family protein [Actinomycetota bacterium]|nr:NAD-dependent epimerase/dehydratase family protein [Actinomycetota bacterium]